MRYLFWRHAILPRASWCIIHSQTPQPRTPGALPAVATAVVKRRPLTTTTARRAASSSSSGQKGASDSTRSSTRSPEEDNYVTVDKKGLYEEVARLMKPEKMEKSPLTPLGKLLQSGIKQVGPISLADFMDLCLAHPEHGYYMAKETAKIGKEGDFVTAPEISQMFGELLGVWGVATWEKLGMPKGIRLVEIGPGKGTLMQDILRVGRNFPAFHRCLSGVHLVETSKDLRKVQAQTLGAIEEKRLDEEGKQGSREEEDDDNWELGGIRASVKPRWHLPSLSLSSKGAGQEQVGIDWHDDIRQVPVGGPLLIYAQELLDALPVHQFEYTADGWRERLVDVDEDPTTPQHFKLILAPGPTPAVAFLEQRLAGKLQALKKKKKEEEAGGAEDWEVGTGIEVCPLAVQIIQHVAERVSRTGGAALFVDYGEDYAQADSLRGLKRHAHVDALSEPGAVDLSADVDFSLLKDAIKGMEGVQAFGPMPQGQFLSAMGIETRLQALLDTEEISERQALLLYDSYRRLVDPDQMGRKYKVMALCARAKHQGPAVAFPATTTAVEEEEEGGGEEGKDDEKK